MNIFGLIVSSLALISSIIVVIFNIFRLRGLLLTKLILYVILVGSIIIIIFIFT
ncbi:hypothetical protein CHREV_225 [Choristoneura rosaceana entomopoxvirus 'L']|uniref:Uncharacterized protein n=2 Tax=Betaentomopoxvirus TaxID=10286 RepID=A0A916NY14_CBEPV|nr:hypothetical protein CHBEV_259 [Choristoneura biennis entomopoxvirus]YP_008004629.1 hypothetical protein CHREV_225 [Choristoneura rosaceana entomopoxvirus 'L']CCU55827.1 hypothetical protein CHBEV_259 [Choristoneura biennis entomopoxvirus]CCU56127.1 hypothetical protein CHREV_225 [Choristoneura rosaceana entomopoxvirus 'L']